MKNQYEDVDVVSNKPTPKLDALMNEVNKFLEAG